VYPCPQAGTQSGPRRHLRYLRGPTSNAGVTAMKGSGISAVSAVEIKRLSDVLEPAGPQGFGAFLHVRFCLE